MIFQKNGDELLSSIAIKNNLDIEKVIAAYLIMGEQFLLMLHVLEGQELKIPSKRRLCSPSLHNIHFIEDDEQKYRNYEKDDIIDVDEDEYVVVSEEKKFLNHWYIPVMKVED